MNKQQAYRIMRELRGPKAYVEHRPAFRSKDRKLRDGTIKEGKDYPDRYAVGTVEQLVPGFAFNSVDAESCVSWDDVIEKARKVITAEKERFAAWKAKRNK